MLIRSFKISAQLAYLALLFPVVALSQGYNKRSDYNYHFENANAKVEQAEIVKNELSLPVFMHEYQTAFLEVDIRTSIGGRLIEPKVRLTAGDLDALQYFEYGAKGKRYINISEFVQNGAKTVGLNFDNCRLADKQVRLILFHAPDVAKERLLVLAPHPDDAEIAAYGLYASNNSACVANITIGDAGKTMYDELYPNDTTHYLKKADLRLWNSITVPLLAGLQTENVVNLGYFDASLKQMYTDSTVLARGRYTGVEDINMYREQNISGMLDTIAGVPTWRSLVNDLKYLVALKQPTVIVTPYPAIDVHPDHKLTTVALVQALKELNYTDVELWLYTNHFVNDENYPAGKARSIISLPPNTLSEQIYFDRISSVSLSYTRQSDKVLALEAMNPLRPDTEWHTTKGSRKLYWKTLRENIRNTESDYYYRRAVRNNELFFVVDMKSLLDESTYKKITGSLNF